MKLAIHEEFVGAIAMSADREVEDVQFVFHAAIGPHPGRHTGELGIAGRFEHIVAHGGGLPGFGSYMAWLPEYGVGIFAMAVGLGSLTAMLEEGNSKDWFNSNFIRMAAVLAVVGLCVASAVIRNLGKPRLAFVTLIPMCFIATTTMSAGYLSIVGNFLPLAETKPVQGYLDTGLTVGLMVGVVIILGDALRSVLRGPGAPSASVSPTPAPTSVPAQV